MGGGGWSTPRPGHFTTGRESRNPSHRRLGGRQGRSGRARKISSPPAGFDPRTAQLVATGYSDCTTSAHSDASISHLETSLFELSTLPASNRPKLVWSTLTFPHFVLYYSNHFYVLAYLTLQLFYKLSLSVNEPSLNYCNALPAKCTPDKI